MCLKTIKSICLGCLALLIIFYSPKIDALSHEWVAVPKSQYGDQLWDKNSIEEHQDGFIRMLSKFIPKALLKSHKTFYIQWMLTVQENPSEMLQ